ncbi:MAG: hypothetical protein ACRDOY_10330 [Nocardioidaceae bacterium]
MHDPPPLSLFLGKGLPEDPVTAEHNGTNWHLTGVQARLGRVERIANSVRASV